MTSSEQLRFVTPEYARTLSKLDTLVASLPNQFPDDIEYSRSGYRLPLRVEDIAFGAYYAVTKALPYPYPENPDWSAIPAKLGQVTEQGDSSGYITHYEVIEGMLSAVIDHYENNEFLDEEPSVRELSDAEIQKIIKELSAAQPAHPDKVEHEQTGKTAKIRVFIQRLLFRK